MLDCRHRRVQPVAFQLAIEGAPADAEQPRRYGLVATHLFERPDDVLALDLDERSRPGGDRDGRGTWPRPGAHRGVRLLQHAVAQLRLVDELAFGQDAGALEHVPELTDVPFPRRVGEAALGSRRETDERLPEALCKTTHERRRQVRDIFAAL